MLRFRIDLSAFSSEAPHANNETGMRPLRSALLFLTTQCFCENQRSHELANYCTRGGTLDFVVHPKSLLPRAHSSVSHTYTDMLNPYALMPFCCTNIHMQADTQTSTQHTRMFKTPIHSQSCIHLFVYTLAHTPPLITLKCTHTCAATHKHNRHDRQ